jgi:hypothetical protein
MPFCVAALTGGVENSVKSVRCLPMEGVNDRRHGIHPQRAFPGLLLLEFNVCMSTLLCPLDKK